jgi:hypothetical protein
MKRVLSEPANPDGSDPARSSEAAVADESDDAIPGDRGIPSINRARSIQSKVSSVLAMTLMSALGLVACP